ncbi:hypothetical protein HYE54_09525 [Aggregatibacter actinomycetemcomitans]|uniref:hypothetical protein n=1 Tax=Aggregatibacter actinomycetemcomitans TaxID=714 RepID=UPI00197B3495|nr:hypothetical protein [Aggregatibacter actinomycetemcomitans]MBN6068959.1 hypothetical protein [Aggregatibacter actinomycetemcomitans]MBN6087041.1 hypothetical protein [Aggregatibacter actinomycetemcomitans]
MNEINISIPYSLFARTFSLWFGNQLAFTASTAIYAIEQAKKYWVLFDSDLRLECIYCAKSVLVPLQARETANEFLKWAHENRNIEREYNNPRPLVDVLPVVDLKLYGDKKC